MVKRLLLFITIFISFIFANSSLESKIAKLQTAPKSQRYKLMNEIKRELAKMNTKQRAKALSKLRASMQSSTHNQNYGNMQNGAKNSSGYMHSHTPSNIKHMINKTDIQEHMNMPKGPTQPSVPTKPYNPFEHGGNSHSGPKKGQHGK